jgi:hypothetical protein
MTINGPLGERPARSAPPVAAPQLLDLCDRLIGEVGRRRHLFGWLRRPGSEDWVAVDAYYPGNRLVVVCRDERVDEDGLIETHVPEHGLRLLRLEPAQMLADPDGVEISLERELAALAPVPPRPRAVPAQDGPGAVARAVASLAPAPVATAQAPPVRRVGQSQAEARARAARFIAAHQRPATPRVRTERPPRPSRRRPVPPRPSRRPPVARAKTRSFRPPRREPAGRLGVVVAVVLALAVIAEVYFGVIRWALDGGYVLLAFGIALDAGARALGTIAAGRAGDRAGAWRCALGGSPFVAGFALYGPEGPVAVDPAPIAGLLALGAVSVVAIAVVAAALGM